MLKILLKNKDIVILKQDKGNGVVILNKVDYIKGINKIGNDKHKFKELSNDPTRNRESKLQCCLRNLKNKSRIDTHIFYLSIRLTTSAYLWSACNAHHKIPK